MISLLITLLVVLLIAGIFYWAISQIPLPPPVHTVLNVAFAIVLIIVIAYWAAPYLGRFR